MYLVAIPTILVCLLLALLATPTSLFNHQLLFLYLSSKHEPPTHMLLSQQPGREITLQLVVAY